jgi:rhodanese-related sulfurtransferase
MARQEAATSLERLPERDDAQMVPRRLADGLVEVDVTWGTVQPLTVAEGVKTIGELELIKHLTQGLSAIDTRLERFHREATIPGARWIPHEEILEHVDELDRTLPTVFFCNGPQCTATPDAIRALLDHGYPAKAILYYRGGIHDWMTLGYPTESGPAS